VSAFRRGGGWVAKFQHRAEQVWVPGGPWQTKSAAQEAERRHRERITARATEETCASFAERWLEEWPREAASTRQLYRQAAERFSQDFGPTPLGDVERLSARSWALGVPRNISKIIGTLYEDARNVGLVDSNPFANLRLPATERTADVAPPTLEEFRALLNGCTVLGGYAAEFRALIQFTAWSGLRSGELQALQWRDVGTEDITVRRSRKTDGSYGRPRTGRSGRSHSPNRPGCLTRSRAATARHSSFIRRAGRRLRRGTSTTTGAPCGMPPGPRSTASLRASRRFASTTCATSVRPSCSSLASITSPLASSSATRTAEPWSWPATDTRRRGPHGSGY
jgi:integrase